MVQVTADLYREALKSLGLTQAGAARVFAVNERTSRRWALGEQDIPKAVEIALKLMLFVGARRLAKLGIL